MGGSSLDHEHERIPVCRTCHEDIHEGVLRLQPDFRETGIATWLKRGILISVRPVRPFELYHEANVPDFAFASAIEQASLFDDQNLAGYWELGEQHGVRGLMMQCIVANEFRARYGAFGDSWYAKVRSEERRVGK